MTDHTAPERIWANVAVWGNGEPLAGEWNYRDVGNDDDIEYIRADLHRAEVDALVAAAQCLRDAQRAYMANRGNNDLGRQVGIRAEELDAALAAFTPTDSRAALRAHTEAAVRRALAGADLEAQLAKSMAHFLTVDEWKGYKRGVQEYAAKVRALAENPAQFIKEQ